MRTQTTLCSLLIATLAASCATDGSDSTFEIDDAGGGKGDGSTADRQLSCRIYAMLLHETPGAFPNLFSGDVLGFTLQTRTVTETISPRNGGGTVKHKILVGHGHISQDVRQLDPDFKIVSVPFAMDINISKPRVSATGNIMQTVTYRSDVFDVLHGTMHTLQFEGDHNALSMIPYVEDFWGLPNAEAATRNGGDLVGGFLHCDLSTESFDFDEDSIGGGNSIDDVGHAE